MPLGKLSKGQIAKGFEVLDDIDKVLNKKGKGNINELSSKFYTVIPHDFGRNVPPPINTIEKLRQRMDMLLVSIYMFFVKSVRMSLITIKQDAVCRR